MQVPNKKILPTLLLVLQCLFQVLRGQYFNRSNNIKLAAYLFLAVLNQLVILSMRNFSKHLIERKKGFGRYSVLSSVLLTKFGLSVSSVWSPGLIEKLTIMKWSCDFQRYNKLGSYIFDFVLTRSLNQKNLKWNCFALICCLSINFTLKNIFYVG